MTYIPFLVLLLFLVTSQFYTLFFVEVGLLFTLPTLLLLPTGLIILLDVFFGHDSTQPGKFVQILRVGRKIIFAQLVYLLGIYIFSLTIKGYGFFADQGFWITYIQNYHLGYVYRSLQDLLVGYGTIPILILLIPSIISSIAFSWIFYWFRQWLNFMKKQ